MSPSHRAARSLGPFGAERAGSRSGADEGGARRRTEKRGDERARVFARVSHGIRQGQAAASSEEPAPRLMQWVAGVGRHPRLVSETHLASGARGSVRIRPRADWRRGARCACSLGFIEATHVSFCLGEPFAGPVSSAPALSRIRTGPREVSVARRSGAWPGAGAKAAGCGPRRRTDGRSDERARSLRARAVLAAAASKSSRHGEELGRAVTRGLAHVGPCPCGSLPPAVCGHPPMRPVYTAPRV
jgi:hypothetical protein